MKYVIITPAKNEGQFIEKTLKSVIEQTILPQEWIIVDDGSNDTTYMIASEYAKKHKWIKVLKIENFEEQRSGGSKVVKAFNKGFAEISYLDYEVIVKLDADLILPQNYFEKMFELFNQDPKIGVVGGLILNAINGELIQEGIIDYHVRGAFKTYRRACFEDIGGFKPIWSWDGIDEMEALYKGWKTKVIDIKVVHLRPTTSAYNLVEHAYKSGYEAYKNRTSLFMTILRVLFKLNKKPFVIGSFNYFKGYIDAFIKKEDFNISKEVGKYINKFHFKRIIKLNS